MDSDVVEEKDNDDVCIIDWIPRNPLGQWEQYTSVSVRVLVRVST